MSNTVFSGSLVFPTLASSLVCLHTHTHIPKTSDGIITDRHWRQTTSSLHRHKQPFHCIVHSSVQPCCYVIMNTWVHGLRATQTWMANSIMLQIKFMRKFKHNYKTLIGNMMEDSLRSARGGATRTTLQYITGES